MVQPLVSRDIPADFLMLTHHVFGQIKVSNTGIKGVFSDINSSFVEVNEASMSRIVKPDKIVNYAASIYLVKDQIVAVCLNKREYVGSSMLARGGYQRVIEYPVQITTPVYEISGTLEWAGRFDFSALMADTPYSFLILYDGELSATLFPALHVQSEAILFNRKYISSLVVLKRSAASESQS